MTLSELHKRLAKTDEFPGYVKVPALTSSSWLFQGVLYMDKTERAFKMLLDLLLFLPLYSVLKWYYGTLLSAFVAVILAHTFNWAFNGQIFVLLKILGLINTEEEQFNDYLDNIKKRLEKEKSIYAAAAFGSFSRGEAKKSSDLDIRIVRRPGVINGLRACSFGVFERSRALFKKFPLDLYVVDSKKHLSKLRDDEVPVVLYDPDNFFNQFSKNK